MKVQWTWLEELVTLPLSPEALADRLTMTGTEVEALESPCGAARGIRVGRIRSWEPPSPEGDPSGGPGGPGRAGGFGGHRGGQRGGGATLPLRPPGSPPGGRDGDGKPGFRRDLQRGDAPVRGGAGPGGAGRRGGAAAASRGRPGGRGLSGLGGAGPAGAGSVHHPQSGGPVLPSGGGSGGPRAGGGNGAPRPPDPGRLRRRGLDGVLRGHPAGGSGVSPVRPGIRGEPDRGPCPVPRPASAAPRGDAPGEQRGGTPRTWPCSSSASPSTPSTGTGSPGRTSGSAPPDRGNGWSPWTGRKGSWRNRIWSSSAGTSSSVLAGVMGGLDSEIVPETKRILLESAVFEPSRVSRTSRRLGLPSQAAFRFSRGPGPGPGPSGGPVRPWICWCAGGGFGRGIGSSIGSPSFLGPGRCRCAGRP